MAKYLVETYYTCTFKVNHYLDDINETELKNLEKRDDGKFEVLDVKLDNRKTKSLDPNNKKIVENKKIDVVASNNKSTPKNLENIIKSNSNNFEKSSMFFVNGTYDEKKDGAELFKFLSGEQTSIEIFSGELTIQEGKIIEDITIINNRSIAEEVLVSRDNTPYTGTLSVRDNEFDSAFKFSGKSLVKSAVLTSKAFNKGFFGNYGEYIVSIGLLLFAFFR